MPPRRIFLSLSPTTVTATSNLCLLKQLLPQDTPIYSIPRATGLCELTPLPGSPSRCLQFLDPVIRRWICDFIWSPQEHSLAEVCANMDLRQCYRAVESAIMNMLDCTGEFSITEAGRSHIMENSNVVS